MSMHRTRSVAALLLVGSLSVGCQNSIAPPSAESQALPGMEIQNAEFGQVDIRVRWPQALQAIPYSANALHVAAFDGFGRIAFQTTLTRASSPDAMSTASLRLRAGTYTIEARAFRETTPSLASQPTAIGSSGGVRVKSNLRTNLSLTLIATPPTFGALSPAVGGPGATFTIDAVRFFGRSVKSTDIVEVFLAQEPKVGKESQYRVRATVSIEPRRRLDPVTAVNQMVDPEEDMIRVTVPRGLKGECKVWLLVDGIEVDAGTFQVVDRMAFTHPTVTRAVGETVDASRMLQAHALDTKPAIAYPAVTWRSSAPDIAFVTTGGMVYAYRPGTATITAQTGDVATAFTLLSTDRHSTASITVGVPLLGSGGIEVPVTLPAYSGDDVGTVTH